MLAVVSAGGEGDEAFVAEVLERLADVVADVVTGEFTLRLSGGMIACSYGVFTGFIGRTSSWMPESAFLLSFLIQQPTTEGLFLSPLINWDMS